MPCMLTNHIVSFEQLGPEKSFGLDSTVLLEACIQ